MKQSPTIILTILVNNLSRWIKAKSSSSYWIFVWFGVVILLLWGQKQTSVASAPPSEEVQTPYEALLENFQEELSLPPLEDASAYLPDFKDTIIFPGTEQETRLVLKLGERRVYLFRGDNIEAVYPVAVGKTDTPTPTGEFEVIQMVVDPIWEDPWTGKVHEPGADSPLGLRWIGFWTDGRDSIGFHGTPTLSSIGKAASNGCVRMHNQDVMALFSKVEMGTPVVVEP